MIEAFVLDGTVTLVALAFLAIEVAALFLFARRHMPVFSVIANGLSGACLILALRAALVGHGATAIALWLALGLAAHLADLIVRLRA